MTKSDQNKKTPAAALSAKPKPKYTLKFVPEALEEWQDLDGSVKDNFKQILRKRLDNPHVPGAELKGDLKGYYKIKLRQQGYRLVYCVEDDTLVVMVMAVDKREESLVYRSALSRVTEKMKEVTKTVKDKLSGSPSKKSTDKK